MQKSIPLLWGLVIILLIFNLFLLDALNLARRTAIETLSEVESTLDSLASEVIVYQVEINQAIPIKANVPINQTIEVPLNTVVPIDQVLTVPFQIGASRTNLEMPVKTEVPLNLVVPVAFNETIAIDTTVQLATTLPVEIDIAQTGLASYLNQAKEEIVRLRERLTLPNEMQPAPAAAAVAAAAGPTGDETEPQPVVPSTSPVVTTDPTVEMADVPNGAVEAVAPRLNQAAESGLCQHPYWPLQTPAVWRYQHPEGSYQWQAVPAADNQLNLSSEYEGQAVQASLTCEQGGLGGSFLGDMRRLREFGELEFNNVRGLFLPAADTIENQGSRWTQEFDIVGTVQAFQDDRPLSGRVGQGRGQVVYTTTGREVVQTLLGPQEAIRIEQKIRLELPLEFSLGNGVSQASETVDLTSIYWFVKDIGLVKLQWQGGLITWNFSQDWPAVQYPTAVPALPEETLASICPLDPAEPAACLQLAQSSPATLSGSPEIELELPALVFPLSPAGPSARVAEPTSGKPDPEEIVSPDSPTGNHQDQADLLAYAETIARLGDSITTRGEEFGNIALAFKAGDLTLEEFEARFSSFASAMRALIDEMEALSPPPPGAEIHQKLTNGLAKCDQGLDYMEEWFDNPNSETKETTALLVATCINEVTGAAAELESLVQAGPAAP